MVLACESMDEEVGAPPGPGTSSVQDGSGATVRDSSGITIGEHPGDIVDREYQRALAATPEVVIGMDDELPGHALSRVARGFRTSDGRIFLLESLPPEVRMFEQGKLVHMTG